MHKLKEHLTEPTTQIDHNLSMDDGNVLFQSLIGLPETFGKLALKIFNSLSKSKEVHFVTDCYIPDSIKANERSRRGESSANAFILGGPLTKLPTNWKLFLSNYLLTYLLTSLLTYLLIFCCVSDT